MVDHLAFRIGGGYELGVVPAPSGTGIKPEGWRRVLVAAAGINKQAQSVY